MEGYKTPSCQAPAAMWPAAISQHLKNEPTGLCFSMLNKKKLLAQLCRKSLVQNYVRYFLDEDENSPPPAPPPEKDLEPSKLCPTHSPKKRPAEDPKTPQTPLVNKQKEVMAPAPAPAPRKTGPLKNIPSQVQGLSGEFFLFLIRWCERHPWVKIDLTTRARWRATKHQAAKHLLQCGQLTFPNT